MDAPSLDHQLLSASPSSVPLRGPRLVAFSGPAGSGKSVAGMLLVHQGWARVKFADVLKAMLTAYYEITGLDPADIEARIEGNLKELPDPLLKHQSPRHAMQTLGGDWGRNLMHKELWVNAWRKRVQLLMAAGYDVVVDDLRYPNEENAVRDLGGEIYQIQRETPKDVPSHASEDHVCDADEVIENNGSIRSLFAKVSETLKIN